MNIFDIKEIVLEFEIIGKENIATRSVYHIEEESLMTYGGKQETSLCIENTYLTIDIDIDTGLVVGISGFLGDIESAIVILIVITINAILGTVQTVKAVQSLNSLKE